MVYEDSKCCHARYDLIIGYLDNSPKNISAKAQQDVITRYVERDKVKIDKIICDSDIKNIINSVKSENNTLIFANIVCLGDKLAKIVENIEFLLSNGCKLFSVKENLPLDSSEKNIQLTHPELKKERTTI